MHQLTCSYWDKTEGQVIYQALRKSAPRHASALSATEFSPLERSYPPAARLTSFLEPALLKHLALLQRNIDFNKHFLTYLSHLPLAPTFGRRVVARLRRDAGAPFHCMAAILSSDIGAAGVTQRRI
jgi:hypothetical protein